MFWVFPPVFSHKIIFEVTHILNQMKMLPSCDLTLLTNLKIRLIAAPSKSFSASAPLSVFQCGFSIVATNDTSISYEYVGLFTY